MVSRVFSLPGWPLPLLRDTRSGGYILNEVLHSVRAEPVSFGPSHGRVHTQGKCCRRMAQIFLHRLNVIPALNCHDRVGMLQVVELGVRRKAPLSGLSRPQKIPGSVRTRDFLFFLSTGPLLFLCRTAKIGLENIILGSVWQAVTRHIPIRVGSHSAQQSLTAPRTARAGSHPCHWGRLLEYITKERGSIPTKCFNHPDQDAVATCQKCGKGLCRECAAKYMPCMCDACVEWEQNVEQQGKNDGRKCSECKSIKMRW